MANNMAAGLRMVCQAQWAGKGDVNVNIIIYSEYLINRKKNAIKWFSVDATLDFQIAMVVVS